MEKKFLLAVDDSLHSKQAIEYAVSLASVITDVNFTLLNVQPAISGFLLDEAKTDSKANIAVKKLIKKNTEKSNAILENLKSSMVNLGIPVDKITTISQPRILGLAKDILERAISELFDVIIIGRRGLTGLQEVFMGSVTNKILDHIESTPICIVDGEIKSNKIMVAIDGSESSLKAVKHIGFIASNSPDAHLTLFHVIPKAEDYCQVELDEDDKEIESIISKTSKQCIEKFYELAKNVFKENGLKESQITIKEGQKTGNIGKSIMEEANAGNYGTIVVGRRGMSKSFFGGSVSKHIINKTSGKAIWIAP
ncbi:MAG: universal stress protein [Desulfobacterales bacterium]|nr:universal stress protein [Desulfobacterales bacterium]